MGAMAGTAFSPCTCKRFTFHATMMRHLDLAAMTIYIDILP